MKMLFSLIVLIILAAGGYYLYMQSAPATMEMDEPDTNINVIPQPPITAPSVSTSTATTSATTGAVREITVSSTGMVFSPKNITVQQGERVRITYQNGGGTHDLRVDGYDVGTEVISGGQSETFEFVADEAGDFQFYCSVGNHRAMGMWGTLTVE